MVDDDENLCVICFENEPDAVIMNCGHGGLCYRCAIENWKKGDMCVICRGHIEKILKVAHHGKIKISKVLYGTKKVVQYKGRDGLLYDENGV